MVFNGFGKLIFYLKFSFFCGKFVLMDLLLIVDLVKVKYLFYCNVVIVNIFMRIIVIFYFNV